MEESSPSPMSLEHLPAYKATPSPTSRPPPAPKETCNSSDSLNCEKRPLVAPVTPVVRSGSPPRKNFAVPKSGQRGKTNKRIRAKRSSTPRSPGRKASDNATPRHSQGFDRLCSIAQEFRAFEIPAASAHQAGSSTSGDTPMGEAIDLDRPRTPNIQKSHAAGTADDDDDHSSATERLKQCAKETSQSKRAVAPTLSCHPSSGFTPINGSSQRLSSRSFQDASMDEAPLDEGSTNAEASMTSPPRRSMSSKTKNWRNDDAWLYDFHRRQEAIANVGDCLSDSSSDPSPVAHREGRNSSNVSNERTISVVSTQAPPSAKSDDNAVSVASTEKPTPPKQKAGGPILLQPRIEPQTNASRSPDEHATEYTQASARTAPVHPPQEVATPLARLPRLSIPNEGRNDSSTSEGNAGSMETTPDTTPPDDKDQEPEFPPHELASYTEVVSNRGPHKNLHHEGPEDLNLPNITCDRATLPFQTNLPPVSEVLKIDENDRAPSQYSGAPRTTPGQGLPAGPITLPLPRTPLIPTNSDLPANNRWAGQRFKNIKALFPADLETRRFEERPNGQLGALMPGPSHLGPPIKPFDDPETERIALELSRALARQREAEEWLAW